MSNSDDPPQTPTEGPAPIEPAPFEPVVDDIFNRPRTMAAPPPYAGFGIRALASLVDSLVLVLVTLPIDLIFGASADPTSAAGFFQLLISLIYQGYLPTTEWRGTLGKKLFNLKIETLDGQRINSLTSLRRLSLFLALQPILVIFPPPQPVTPETLAAALPALICVMILAADVLLVLVRPDKRAVHDLIAGTCVRAYPARDDD